MPFIRVPGLQGKVFVPENDCRTRKKYPCKDCHSCQMCSDDRCAVCRGQKDKPGKSTRCRCDAKKTVGNGL